MSQKIILYWGSGSVPCWRLQLALEEKNVQYENKFLSFDKKEHKSDEIMHLNPRGQVINISSKTCLN
jgi:glutathione S-transferase